MRREARSLAVERVAECVRVLECRRMGAQLEVLATFERGSGSSDSGSSDSGSSDSGSSDSSTSNASSSNASAVVPGESVSSDFVASGSGAAVLLVPREIAVVATTELLSDDEAELRSMARLAIARETATEGVETLGDFQIESRSSDGARAIVAAVPAAAVAAMRAAVQVPVARATVRALGTLALLRSAPELRRGLVLVVDTTVDSVELIVARDGSLLSSRGLSIPAEGRGPLAAREEALPAVRMLLASLKSADSGANIALSRVLFLGSSGVFEALSPELARLTGASVQRLESHPLITYASIDASARETFLSSCWPLAGALLEDELALRRDGSAIDFLAPTGLIDVAARTRQRILLVAGVVVVAALAGWTLGTREWRALENRRDDLESKARNALPELRRMKRDELRLKHIEAHGQLSPDWLAHLDILRRFAPDPNVVVLDGMTAQLSGTEIEYSKTGSFDATPELRFVVDGEAKDRGVADALRDALVREKGYTLGSTGADARGGRRLPAPFAYTLRTTELAPSAAKEPASTAGANNAAKPPTDGARDSAAERSPSQPSNTEAKQ